ncbi:MAG: hypothetical protein NC299_17410 [Lachnospiraceae bacterium]|nr:hypothetical protein [Lachnospiraceae bacterium]
MEDRNKPALKCKTCGYCRGGGSGSARGRYYCGHPDAAKEACASAKPICYTPRWSNEFTIKRTPKWCPLKFEVRE